MRKVTVILKHQPPKQTTEKEEAKKKKITHKLNMNNCVRTLASHHQALKLPLNQF